MNRQSAIFLSVVFHPVLVNGLSLALLFVLFPGMAYALQPKLKWFYYLFILITTGLFPLAWVLTGALLRRYTLFMDEKEERNIPYLITAAVYLADFYLSRKTHAPGLLSAYLLGCSTVMVVVLVTNYFYKISIHAAALGALSGVIIAAVPYTSVDLRVLLALSAVLGGLVISARLFLQAHTLAQTIYGFVMACIIMFLML